MLLSYCVNYSSNIAVYDLVILNADYPEGFLLQSPAYFEPKFYHQACSSEEMKFQPSLFLNANNSLYLYTNYFPT